MNLLRSVILGTVFIGALILAGCQLPESFTPSGVQVVTPTLLAGRWEELQGEQGTGLFYEFHMDETMTLVAQGISDPLLVGTYEILHGGAALRLRWIEPATELQFDEEVWTLVSGSKEELVFELSDGGGIRLRRAI